LKFIFRRTSNVSKLFCSRNILIWCILGPYLLRIKEEKLYSISFFSFLEQLSLNGVFFLVYCLFSNLSLGAFQIICNIFSLTLGSLPPKSNNVPNPRPWPWLDIFNFSKNRLQLWILSLNFKFVLKLEFCLQKSCYNKKNSSFFFGKISCNTLAYPPFLTLFTLSHAKFGDIILDGDSHNFFCKWVRFFITLGIKILRLLRLKVLF